MYEHRFFENRIHIFSFVPMIRTSNVGELRIAVDSAINSGSFESLLFNMQDVEMVDSLGFAWLIETYNTMVEQNIPFVLCGTNPKVYQIMKLLKIDEILENYDSENEAIDVLREKVQRSKASNC